MTLDKYRELRRQLMATDYYRNFKFNVLERDRYTCRKCGKRKGQVEVEVHHKKAIFTHPKLALVESNAVTLCTYCHHLEHGRI